MKQVSLLKAYIIYIFTCISIIALYLHSMIIKETSEMFGQPKPLLSQYYDLGTVARIGVGLNLYYYFYTKKQNEILSIFHLILSILLAVFVISGLVSMAIYVRNN